MPKKICSLCQGENKHNYKLCLRCYHKERRAYLMFFDNKTKRYKPILTPFKEDLEKILYYKHMKKDVTENVNNLIKKIEELK